MLVCACACGVCVCVYVCVCFVVLNASKIFMRLLYVFARPGNPANGSRQKLENRSLLTFALFSCYFVYAPAPQTSRQILRCSRTRTTRGSRPLLAAFAGPRPPTATVATSALEAAALEAAAAAAAVPASLARPRPPPVATAIASSARPWSSTSRASRWPRKRLSGGTRPWSPFQLRPLPLPAPPRRHRHRRRRETSLRVSPRRRRRRPLRLLPCRIRRHRRRRNHGRKGWGKVRGPESSLLVCFFCRASVFLLFRGCRLLCGD